MTRDVETWGKWPKPDVFEQYPYICGHDLNLDFAHIFTGLK